MSYDPDPQRLEAVRRAPAETRYDYLVEETARNGELWILRDEDGFVMFRSETEECIPVWPHPACAETWATGGWGGCRPMAVDLDAWLARWTPGLDRDAIHVAAFPVEEEDVVVVTPGDFALAVAGEEHGPAETE